MTFYIFNTLSNTTFESKGSLAVFIVFVLPYIFKNLIGGYYLIRSLFIKAKDIDDSNLAALISIIGTNLSIFLGLFHNLNSSNPNLEIAFAGAVLSAVVFPFYFTALISLGKNLTILPEANFLNTKGIYSISRHPLYLCYVIWYILQILICQTWIIFFISIFQIWVTIVRAKFEENILEKNFPTYKEYRNSVGWIGPAQNA
ncbi:MAG: methyltransferase family protein [Solirubrobacterales bacterium]